MLFSFHHIENITSYAGIYLGTIKILIWFTLVICVTTLGFFLSKSKKISKIIPYVLIGVLLAPIVNVSATLYKNISVKKVSAHLEPRNASEINLQYKPNVYWLIPDMYARNDILKEEYGFDNSDFLGALRRRLFCCQ